MLYTALIFGLLSSFHCLGMCGPIAMMLPVSRDHQGQRMMQILTYHLGRLTSYATLGLLFGLLGKGLYFAGLQKQISIIAGILMILYVLIPENKWAKIPGLKLIYKLYHPIKNHLGQQFKRKTFDAFFSIGILNGFLPCGLVYVALFGALAMGDYLMCALFMILFGLGTVPIMSSITLFSNLLSMPVRNKIRKFVPIMLLFMASLFILRGMNLGIPYLSPSETHLMVQAEGHCN